MYRQGIFILLCAALMLSGKPKDIDWIHGNWRVDLLIQNNDTIYSSSDPAYTYRYHYKLNARYKDQVDTASVRKNADINYQNTARIHFKFSKGIYTAYALRSGLKDANDSGTFIIRNDSIITSNESKRVHSAVFLINERNHTLSIKDSFHYFKTLTLLKKSVK